VAVLAGTSGHDGGREVGENGEEVEGDRFPSSPRCGDDSEREIDGRRRAVAATAYGGSARELRRVRKVAGEVRVIVEGDAGRFIGSGKGQGVRMLAGGWHGELAVMAGEGSTPRCRAVCAVVSRIEQRRGRIVRA
jgi:hypothetical protein